MLQEIKQKLASALGRRDEQPNLELGQAIAKSGDISAVSALVILLNDQGVASDAIKALYECGYQAPALLVPHVETFVKLLDHKNNRMVWGSMTAISCIAQRNPDSVWPYWERILGALQHGSVITRDMAVVTLTCLAASSPSKAGLLSKPFMDAIFASQPKDVAKLALQILPVLQGEALEKTKVHLTKRLPELATSSQKKLERLLKKEKL